MAVNEREFRALYSDHYPLVFNSVYSRIRNTQDAEDICHEIFVAFYKKFDEIMDHRRWLLGSIKYAISHFYRSKGLSDQEIADIDDAPNDPNLAFENGFRDARIIINEAIEDESNYSDRKERILFDLIAINRLTYGEAAKQLGLTRRQAEYKYGLVVRRILDHLAARGIYQAEDMI